MSVNLNGDTGVSKVQDGTIVAADLAGGTGTGNLTQYTTAVTPLPATGLAMTGTHSLGVVPIEAVLELTCLTAEQNYSIGDVVDSSITTDGANSYPVTVYRTTTSVGMPHGTGYRLGLRNKTTGVGFMPTLANWSYRFRVRAA